MGRPDRPIPRAKVGLAGFPLPHRTSAKRNCSRQLSTTHPHDLPLHLSSLSHLRRLLAFRQTPTANVVEHRHRRMPVQHPAWMVPYMFVKDGLQTLGGYVCWRRERGVGVTCFGVTGDGHAKVDQGDQRRSISRSGHAHVLPDEGTGPATRGLCVRVRRGQGAALNSSCEPPRATEPPANAL